MYAFKHFLTCGNWLQVPSALSAAQRHTSNAVLCVLMKFILAEHVNNVFSYLWMRVLQALHDIA